MSRRLFLLGCLICTVVLLVGCAGGQRFSDFEQQLTQIDDLSPTDLQDGRLIRVVASTTILADVVGNIGGDAIELTTILPFGADPHGYQMSASDLQAIRQADIVFLNGLGLEDSMVSSLEQFVGQVPMVSVSEGIEALAFGSGGGDGEHPQGVDPHVWMDPTRVMTWVENIARALGHLDPQRESLYQSSADTYQGKLETLDAWVQTSIESIPTDRRVLVTDHDNLDYFGDHYGMQIVGAIIPAYSAVAEPSARQLAQLQDTIQSMGVPAIFVGTTVNPELANQIAGDLGIQVVPIYTGSLSDPSGPAGTYLALIEYDVAAITEALSP